MSTAQINKHRLKWYMGNQYLSMNKNNLEQIIMNSANNKCIKITAHHKILYEAFY